MDPFKQYRMAERPKNEMEMFRIAPKDEMEPYRMGAAQPDATYFSPYVDYTLPEVPRDPGVIRQLPVDQTPYSWQLSRGMERYNQAHNVIKDVFDENILDPRHREEALDFYDRISTEHPVVAGIGQTFAGEAYDFTKDAVTDPASVVAAPYVAGKSGLQMAKNTGRMLKGLRAGDDVFDASRMVAADVGAQPTAKLADPSGVRVLDDATVAPAEVPVFGNSKIPEGYMGMMDGVQSTGNTSIGPWGKIMEKVNETGSFRVSNKDFDAYDFPEIEIKNWNDREELILEGSTMRVKGPVEGENLILNSSEVVDGGSGGRLNLESIEANGRINISPPEFNARGISIRNPEGVVKISPSKPSNVSGLYINSKEGQEIKASVSKTDIDNLILVGDPYNIKAELNFGEDASVNGITVGLDFGFNYNFNMGRHKPLNFSGKNIKIGNPEDAVDLGMEVLLKNKKVPTSIFFNPDNGANVTERLGSFFKYLSRRGIDVEEFQNVNPLSHVELGEGLDINFNDLAVFQGDLLKMEVTPEDVVDASFSYALQYKPKSVSTTKSDVARTFFFEEPLEKALILAKKFEEAYSAPKLKGIVGKKFAKNAEELFDEEKLAVSRFLSEGKYSEEFKPQDLLGEARAEAIFTDPMAEEISPDKLKTFLEKTRAAGVSDDFALNLYNGASDLQLHEVVERLPKVNPKSLEGVYLDLKLRGDI